MSEQTWHELGLGFAIHPSIFLTKCLKALEKTKIACLVKGQFCGSNNCNKANVHKQKIIYVNLKHEVINDCFQKPKRQPFNTPS